VSEQEPPSRVRRWRAVEPELTHFLDLISLDFDIATDRGTSDRYEQLTTRPSRGAQWPWQRLVLTFWGGPLQSRQTIPVRCIFEGLVFFSFLQDDFEPKINEVEAKQDIFDSESLGGLYVHQGDLPDSVGAFCLWECDDSPLIEKLVARWQPWRPIEERRPWLRHFRTSCDELGDFEFVAGDVTIEKVERSPSPDK